MADLRARTSFHNKLKKLLDAALDHQNTPLTAEGIISMLERAEDIFKKVEDLHIKLLSICTDDDAITAQENAFEPIESDYLQLKASLYKIRSSLTPASTTRPAHQPATIKLPEISLPAFEGRYEDWPSFEDLFTATIDKNKSLSGSQKLQYLKTCTRGDAANLIRSFTVTDANYGEAWKLLKDRYSNNREIVHTIVKKLILQPSIKSESVTSLQTMLNTTLESIRSLKVLGRPTDTWDDLVVVIIVEKLDADTKAEWVRSLKGVDPPTFKELQDFIDQHIRTLYARGSISSSSKQLSRNGNTSNRNQVNSHHITTNSSCKVCSGTHQLFHCKIFLDMQPEKRFEAVRNSKLCFNCLREGHLKKECSSKFTCKKCQKKHNTLLHTSQVQGNNQAQPVHPPSAGSGNTKLAGTTQAITLSSAAETTKQVLLKTALVDVKDATSVKKQCRVLLDDGSEASFITEECVRNLGLKKEKADINVTGIGGGSSLRVKFKTFVRLYSQVHNNHFDVEALIVQKVTETIPRVACEQKSWDHVSNLRLADPYFHEPGEVDILIGADVVPYVVKEGLKQGGPNTPTAQDSIFGWILYGIVIPGQPLEVKSNVAKLEICDILQRFWEIEEVPCHQTLTVEERKCEEHFTTTHTRQADGRYIVKLPFDDAKKKTLGSTREQALSRLHQLERRFQRYPEYKQEYVKFMQEYETLGHMEKVEANSVASYNPTYLPHHFVRKEDSTTTKLRVVFDGSAKSSSGVSLNQSLLVGPTIQADLFTLLIQFRYNQIALKADIAKMYRQFLVHPEDVDYQRILWREDPTQPIQEYRLKTVTYGTSCAPYLATRCIKQLSQDEKLHFPAASEVLANDLYVDDLLSGRNSVPEAIQLVKELNAITATGQMEMRKWCSNNAQVLQSIPEELREDCSVLNFTDDNSIKALGILWQPGTDCFKFSVSPCESTQITKRQLLSEIAKTFDPLGWLAPMTITAKLLFQDLWLQRYDWDQPLTEEMQIKWNQYQGQMVDVKSIEIPRCVVGSGAVEFQLHGFCDSSEKAYASAVYLRTRNADGTVRVHLLTARTKVAPLKQISLPRLELCGANLLADTMNAVQQTLKFPYTPYYWTDSTIVLRWISSHSRRWKTYVANRVAAIQTIASPELWHHVRSEENPADLPSRGIACSDLIQSDLWWHGPEWLKNEEYPIRQVECNMKEVVEEERSSMKICLHASVNSTYNKLFTQFSSCRKLYKAAAYYIRFIQYLKKETYPASPISTTEIQKAKMKLIQWVQNVEFQNDIKGLLSEEKQVPSSSKLINLNPFIDGHGILRVGGRIQNCSLPASRKYPIILPEKHSLTIAIIRDVHLRHLHSGFDLTLATLRRDYWILRARDQIRHCIRKCIPCRRANAVTATQLMGNLPVARVTANRPFFHAGVDFAGPFGVRMNSGRKARPEKCYFAIFVCLATRAIHLEAVTDLTTDSFIACYEKFSSRRGLSAHMYSDCGTNFVGADRQLKKMLQQSSTGIEEKLAAEFGTQWHFNPPSAPHQGGLWEAGVKAVKRHFRRVVQGSVLTYTQFETLLCKIEACLNSRPMCALSSDPLDLDALTPGHFLIGGPITAVPEPNVTLIKQNRLSHWQAVSRLTQTFWKKWHNEYLSTLQQRFNWTQKRNNIQVGDLVVIKDELLPVTRWKLGRVISTHPGKDGFVRSVTLKTVGGQLTRPITKLCPLISNDTE